MTSSAVAGCGGCGAELAPTLLRCPACRTLVHAAALTRLAAAAERAERGGDERAAMAIWRDVLALLPSDAEQRPTVLARVARLSDRVTEGAPVGQAGNRKGVLATVGTFILAILAKAKFLILGLSKIGTLASMFAWFALYWAAYGWRFAGGLVLSIYVHEMGHVAMLARYGIRASAPMFVPGFGAYVRHQAPATVIEGARVGLAGPAWGLGAALVALAVYSAGGQPVWATIAVWGAGINLFNLLPMRPFDGGSAFRSLGRRERWIVAVVLAVGGLAVGRWWLFALAAAAAWRATQEAPAEGDAVGTITYVGLAATLTAVIVGAGPAATLPGAR